MYIFRYNKRLTGELIGYHSSTFCQPIKERENAKYYTCPKGPKSQLQTISNNFKHIMSVKTKEDSMFAGIHLATQENYFKGLTFDDVELVAEEVPDVNIIHKVHTIVSNGNVTKVDMTLENAFKTIIKDVNGPYAPVENVIPQ